MALINDPQWVKGTGNYFRRKFNRILYLWIPLGVILYTTMVVVCANRATAIEELIMIGVASPLLLVCLFYLGWEWFARKWAQVRFYENRFEEIITGE